jgi:hypothetical protein
MIVHPESRDTATATEKGGPAIPSLTRITAPTTLRVHAPQHSALGSFPAGVHHVRILPGSPQAMAGTPPRNTHNAPSFSLNGTPNYGRTRAQSLGRYPTSFSLSPPGMSLRDPNPMALGGGPAVPFLNNEPPKHSESRKAIEAAAQAERLRAKEMEQTEKEMTAEDLRFVLKRERNRMARFAADLALLKIALVQCNAEAEIHEEGLINGLMRSVENLQLEKGRIIVELEQEEEMVR